MRIILASIQEIAPDQVFLNAAKKLLKSAKWPLKQQLDSKVLVWGQCQDSGANPYYTAFDTTNRATWSQLLMILHPIHASRPQRKKGDKAESSQ